MFELNPLANPDALWQHILMIVVAAILGYIIGYISGKATITSLEDELAKLDNDLEYCTNQKAILKTAALSETVNTAREAFTGTPIVIENARKDDLKIIEGIGPKIEIILNNAGIYSFQQLSQKSPDQIEVILSSSDTRFQIHEPATWPRQAELAAKENWKELKDWQEVLKGGREE